MTALTVLARATYRRQWRTILAIALLVGIAGTAVLAAAAGARRTATTLERFETESGAADLEITVGEATASQIRAFERTLGVAAVAALRQIAITLDGQFLPSAAAVDERFATIVDRPRVVTGRVPSLSAPDELAIGEALAARLHVDVGDHLTFESYSQTDFDQLAAGGDAPTPSGPRVRLEVVGIVRRPLDLGARGAAGGVIVPTPAFLEKYPDIASFAGQILRVRTRAGAADVPAVTAAARRIFGASPVFSVTGLGIDSEGARDAIGVLTSALWLFAAIAALSAIVAVGIVLGRQVAYARDQPTLSALGLVRRQRAAAAAAVALPIAVLGALLAVVGGALASALLPFGVARQLEPDPGLRIDGWVLGLGLLAIVVLVLVAGAFGAARLTRVSGPGRERPSDAPRPSALARAATRGGLAPPATTGLRMALEPGHGTTAVPVRSAFIGMTIGVLGVVGVLTFAASLDRLVTTPRLYGWSWDLAVTDPQADRRPDQACAVDTALTRDRAFTALSAVCTLNIEVDGRPTTGWGFTALKAGIEPTIAGGRVPHGPHEVALGASTLDALAKSVGDTVQIRAAGKAVRYQIVGRVVLPSLVEPQPLADGAAFDGAGLSSIASEEAADDGGDLRLVARLAPDANVAALTKRFNDAATFVDERVLTARVPLEIDRLHQVAQLPTILGAFLGLLAAAALGHALVTGVWRRRRDLAILKTLGFDRRQVRATVAWQATALSAAGVVVGIPLGLAAGVLAWRVVANGLGVSTSTAVPVVGLLVIVPAAIALANVVAAIPARWAARTRPAVILRSE